LSAFIQPQKPKKNLSKYGGKKRIVNGGTVTVDFSTGCYRYEKAAKVFGGLFWYYFFCYYLDRNPLEFTLILK